MYKLDDLEFSKLIEQNKIIFDIEVQKLINYHIVIINYINYINYTN